MQNEKLINAIERALQKKLNYAYMTCSYLPEISEIASELAAAIAQLVEPKFYNPTECPARVDGEDFSVDVFVLDEDGVHGIAFWSFDDEVWRFHTDTLVDYNELGHETKWKWYYPPFDKETVLA